MTSPQHCQCDCGQPSSLIVVAVAARRFLFKGLVDSTYTSVDSTLRDTSMLGQLSAEWSARVGALDVTQVVSFGVDDQFFTTTVTLRNTLSSPLYNVEYMRNIDPDQAQVGDALADCRV